MSVGGYFKPSTRPRFGEKGDIRKIFTNPGPASPLASQALPQHLLTCGKWAQSLLQMPSGRPQVGKPESSQVLGAATKSPQKCHSRLRSSWDSPKEAKELQPSPQLDAGGRTTSQTPRAGQGQNTGVEDDGLGPCAGEWGLGRSWETCSQRPPSRGRGLAPSHRAGSRASPSRGPADTPSARLPRGPAGRALQVPRVSRSCERHGLSQPSA